MRKTLLLFTAIGSLIIFANCHSSRKATAAAPAAPKLTYASTVQTLVVNNCSPCHIPAKGGNKKALDTYASVKDNIDDIIRRIELNPGDRGFMPFKHAKLSDSTITAFKDWKAQGLAEN